MNEPLSNGAGKGARPDGRAAPRPAVLIVDDVEANLFALEALLGELPVEIVRAPSGNEALRQLLKRDFAVVLLDVQMPDMDGFEVARHTRDNPRTCDVPIVFITAMNETPDGILRGYASGAFDVLFKPVNPHVVRSKVQVFLDLYVSRRRLVDEIEAHKATLAELSAFNYSVSHDLRAPLRPLVGFSEMLLRNHGEHLDEQGRHYLERIHAGAKRMGFIIDDLLELSRVGRAELKRQAVDLAEVARALVAEFRAEDGARDVAFVCPPRAPVYGDAGLLRIALENLLRNAWKFTRKREEARVELGVLPGDDSTFFVRDNGAGFDPKYAAKLFQPFQRLHTTTDFEGTGIGLAIVNRIVKRHGGKVSAEGAPGAGATFTFTLGEPTSAGARA
ncbi:MAG TPA: ATP-binding protein [Polyangia bacterium]|nr:ATP-binding protein [Polyangia bacterium]